MSTDPHPISWRPAHQSVAFAVVLPILMVAACSMARLMSPHWLGTWVSFETLAIVGLLGYLLGTLALARALRQAKARWVMALVAYDLAMPVALFGLLLLMEAGHRGIR